MAIENVSDRFWKDAIRQQLRSADTALREAGYGGLDFISKPDELEQFRRLVEAYERGEDALAPKNS